MNSNVKTPASKGAKTEFAERSWPLVRRFRFEASPYLFILPFVVFCLLLMFYPVVYSFTLSFR